MRVEVLQPFTCSRDGGSIDLKAGQEAFITGENLLAALVNGGYIRVLPDIAAAVEVSTAPARAPDPLDALEALEEFNAPSEDLAVKHIGRGRYAVHKGDERVTEGMTKDEAEAALAGMQ